MPDNVPEHKPSYRIPSLEALTTEELVARRCELAEQLDPLFMRLEAIDDELMHRRRAERRARILALPPEFACDEPSALQPVGAL